MKSPHSILALCSALLLAIPAIADDKLARGKYLLQISGCNDCHTSGYPEAGGQLPVEQWLTGSVVGFSGPWGTSYPANLRLTVHNMSEAQWFARAREPMLPPMPWFSLRDMSDEDLSAIYHFIKSLGPAGELMPAAAAPGAQVSSPYFDFVPKNLPSQPVAQR